MTVEERLREYLHEVETQVPQLAGTPITGRAPTRHRLAVPVLAVVAGCLAVGLAVALLLPGREPAVAASPITGRMLSVIATSPVVLRGQPSAVPAPRPVGTDLTFQPVETPSDQDLEIIDRMLATLEDPSEVVALGSIPTADLQVFSMAGTDPDTGASTSCVFAVGSEDPQAVGECFPTGAQPPGSSGSRSGEGTGQVFAMVRDSVTYAGLEIDGVQVGWQIPSDGIIWVPFRAGHRQTVEVILHDSTFGAISLVTLDPIAEPLASTLAERYWFRLFDNGIRPEGDPEAIGRAWADRLDRVCETSGEELNRLGLEYLDDDTPAGADRPTPEAATEALAKMAASYCASRQP